MDSILGPDSTVFQAEEGPSEIVYLSTMGMGEGKLLYSEEGKVFRPLAGANFHSMSDDFTKHILKFIDGFQADGAGEVVDAGVIGEIDRSGDTLMFRVGNSSSVKYKKVTRRSRSVKISEIKVPMIEQPAVRQSTSA